MMTDMQIINNALGNALAMLESFEADGDIDDDEDLFIVDYARRVHAAANAGDLSSIRAELEAEEAMAAMHEETIAGYDRGEMTLADGSIVATPGKGPPP